MWHHMTSPKRQGFSIGESNQSSYLELGEIWSNSLNNINRIRNEFIEIQQHHLKVFGTANGHFQKKNTKTKGFCSILEARDLDLEIFEVSFINRNSHALPHFYGQLITKHGIVGPVIFWMRGPPLHRAPILKKKDLQSKITRFFDISGTWVWKRGNPCVSSKIIETTMLFLCLWIIL